MKFCTINEVSEYSKLPPAVIEEYIKNKALREPDEGFWDQDEIDDLVRNVRMFDPVRHRLSTFISTTPTYRGFRFSLEISGRARSVIYAHLSYKNIHHRVYIGVEPSTYKEKIDKFIKEKKNRRSLPLKTLMCENNTLESTIKRGQK